MSFDKTCMIWAIWFTYFWFQSHSLNQNILCFHVCFWAFQHIHVFECHKSNDLTFDLESPLKIPDVVWILRVISITRMRGRQLTPLRPINTIQWNPSKPLILHAWIWQFRGSSFCYEAFQSQFYQVTHGPYSVFSTKAQTLPYRVPFIRPRCPLTTKLSSYVPN